MKEISQRIDGKWNVWDEIPTFDGIRWQVIATFDFEDDAEEFIRADRGPERSQKTEE